MFFFAKCNSIFRIVFNNKSCYVFTNEAANSILNFVNNEKHGVFNVSYKAISEFNLIKLYCNYFNFKIESLINFSIESSDTPFSSNYDFIVDNNKYHNIFPLKNTFENALNKELSKINKK